MILVNGNNPAVKFELLCKMKYSSTDELTNANGCGQRKWLHFTHSTMVTTALRCNATRRKVRITSGNIMITL